MDSEMRNAEPITGSITYHGEGPFWDSRSGRLLCVDMLSAEILAIDSTGNFSRHKVPSRAATVIRRRASGGFVIATERDLIGSDEDFSVFDLIADIRPANGCRTNDGACDPFGGFVIGTMAYDERAGGGAVYRIAPDHQVREILAPVSISNGLQWSADGARAYHVDTPTRCVDVFRIDPESGSWFDRRTHIRIEGSSGYPDGMAIDEEDGLWIALWAGGVIQHYDAAGRLVEEIAVPTVTQPSSCAFGGDDGNILYITTSRQGLADRDQPLAGSLFAFCTQSRGAEVWQFGG